MDLNDARAFVIPRGKYNGQTIQSVASGHPDDVRGMFDDEPGDTEFRKALETFIYWADAEADPGDPDLPPAEDLVDGELDENGDIADPAAYE